MQLWVLKGGRHGEQEERMLDRDLLAIGWHDMPDMTALNSKEELETVYRKTYPEAGEGRVANNVGQLSAFAKRMKKGDLVVVPLKTRSAIAVGEVAGDYRYETGSEVDFRHVRPVKWINKEIPRSKFDKDLLYSFGAFMTVCTVSRNNAFSRVDAIAHGTVTKKEGGGGTEVTGELAPIDLDLTAMDQIRDHINRKFKGHDLARLVEGVLQAKGFFTIRSEPGPDGGVDILASKGPLGFDAPKVCVQVKSSAAPVDVKVLRELIGSMAKVKADQGLLVSWGGFKETTIKDAKDEFFRIRIWDSGAFISELLAAYADLPDELKVEIPLRRIWILTEEQLESA